MELWRKDVDVKLTQFVETSRTTSTAIGELRSMFSTFMRSGTPERRRGPSAKPQKKSGNRVTAAAADITLSEDEFHLDPRDATWGIPPAAQVVDLERMPKECQVAERVVSESVIEEVLVSETQVDPQLVTKAVLESVVEVDAPSLPPPSAPAAPVVVHSQATAKIVAHSPEGREEISAVEKHSVVGENPVEGERETGTPDSGVPSPAPSPANSAGVAGEAEEEDGDAEIGTRQAERNTTDVEEVTGESAKSVEAASGASSPSQKKSRKPPKSPLKVFTPLGVCPVTSSEVRPRFDLLF